MPKLTKEDMTKEALVLRFTTQLTQKDDVIKELELKIISLEKENKSLQRGLSIYSTEDEIIKKTLELRSKSFSPVKVVDTFRYSGIDVELHVIKDIINNISELSMENQIYYKKCSEDYEKEIRINPQILKSSSLSEIMYLMDYTMEMIEDSIDNSEKDKYIKTYKDLLNTKTAILKDVVFGEDGNDRSLEILDNTMEEYRENSNRIVKLSINSNDIKTLNNIN